MAKKKIVVVGAGFAGVSATRLLAKTLKNEAEITVIDKHDFQTSMTQLHEVAASRVEPDAVQYQLSQTIGKFDNVKLVKDSLVELDKANKKAITVKGSYDYDYIIVSMGGEPNDFGVPGVKEYGFTLWSLEDALKIKAQLKKMVEAAKSETNPEKRKALLTFSIAGSGFTGIEMAGELIDWRKKVSKKYNVPESEFTINVVEMMPTIMNILDRSLADKALAYLQNKNINVLVNHGITAVSKNNITVNVGGRDEEKVTKEIAGYTLIWTTGVQGNTEAEGCKLAETERGHRLQANEFMEAVGDENQGIYVAGDVSGYIVPENGRPTPQIAEAAEQTGSTAAKNIIAAIKGGEKAKFEGNYRGTLVSIGSNYAVGTVGKSKLSGFSATFMKHMVYLVYTFEIRSGHYFFKYINDQLFHKGTI
ncbi:NAD(P)/FAD-dependent oxidoreductase [Lactococcus allomyrinae]|uniref:NADH:ubiquinone reductase (non-electrogenic) n=1 Tax=Lactococcus allomyrinae TaxID=2419773 RepID=A0A387BGU6_9LACT|nr:NAD(P)/FAD-dependent oxidoreductase [Lactococcus allomyrinae]AYG00609.1 NAD(P)/FAD-dependent oxidoreductase [Lactococcus allomyrinae]